MGLATAAELHDWTRDDWTHELHLVDACSSGTVVLTAEGAVTAVSAALAQATAELIASLHVDHRATPRDLLEAIRMPLEDLL